MRFSIKAKQVLGVAVIVGLSMTVLSVIHLVTLAHMSLEESKARAELLTDTAFHRAHEVVTGRGDPYVVLREDPGMRSALAASLYSKNVTYAALVDTSGVVVVHSDRTLEGRTQPARGELDALLSQSRLAQLRAIYAGEGRTLEVRRSLFIGGQQIGSIRVGVSTLLMRSDLGVALRPAVATATVALLVAIVVAMLFAQLILRPIHMIRSGLSRLGQGEFGVRLDLPQQDEFGELGSFFNTISARLSADRTALAGQKASLESVVENLEDAVAIFNPDGELLFANPALRSTLAPEPIGRPVREILPADHPYRVLIEETLSTGRSRGPTAARVGQLAGEAPEGQEEEERLVVTHAIHDLDRRLVGVMFVARNLAYLSRVQSTLEYSRKLVALGRLSAGVAHEVKNPLNAMAIHLELLREKLSSAVASAERRAVAVGSASDAVASMGAGAPYSPAATMSAAPAVAPQVTSALQHVSMIAAEIRRLDQVVQGFLKFTRPEELRLQPVAIGPLFQEILQIIEPEIQNAGVALQIDCPADLPEVNGDPAMLQQAFLNLVLNACQATPAGGTLRILCAPRRLRRVEIAIEDTGVGIKPEHLSKVFDLYFTTKEKGSGIGLSMVYRIIQMHDGEIEVQSTPGVGTTFRLSLPQA